MKFQVLLIGFVALMTVGAISVAQSVPTGSTAASPQVQLHIPPSTGAVSADVETRATGPALTPAKLTEVPFVAPALPDKARSPEVIITRAPQPHVAKPAKDEDEDD